MLVRLFVCCCLFYVITIVNHCFRVEVECLLAYLLACLFVRSFVCLLACSMHAAVGILLLHATIYCYASSIVVLI